jgi:hypothetical protein
MKNWNYDNAVKHIAAIEDVSVRKVVQLFLSDLVRVVVQKTAYPEGEFDLLFYTKVITKIAEEHEVVRKCLEGIEFDAGWSAIAEVFSESKEK